jgi:hypothetical protein
MRRTKEGQISEACRSASKNRKESSCSIAVGSRAGGAAKEELRRPSWRGHDREIDLFERKRLSVLPDLRIGQSHACGETLLFHVAASIVAALSAEGKGAETRRDETR